MSKCKKCNDKGWYFVDEWVGTMRCKIRRYTDMNLDECLNMLNKILDNHHLSWIPISQIPSVLLDDFETFNIGNTMAMIDGVECVPYRDFIKWMKSVHGIEIKEN